MLVIGLVGGVASGKSFVAQCFEALGAKILDADRIGHDVLNLPEVMAKVQSIWPQVLLREGRIDRKSLAQIVFDENAKDEPLRKLENITHPLIGTQIDAQLADWRAKEAVAAILDAPVMHKAGWHGFCDKIVFVEADLAVRQQRAAARGWSADEISKRERFQNSLQQKRLTSTDIVENSNSKNETISQVRNLWKNWGLKLLDESSR